MSDVAPNFTAGLAPPGEVLARFRAHDGSLGDFLAARVERQPDRAAVEFDDGRWTYADLDERAARWAGWLHGRGVGRGTTVAVMSLNHPSTVALLFAVARLGAVLVPINPDYGPGEARYVLAHAEVAGILASPDKRSLVEEALAGTGLASWVATFDRALDAEVAAAAPWRSNRGEAASCCLIIYTSGTTGFPKGAMHGQRGFTLTAEAFIERLWLQPDERVLCVMPMFHINALMYSVGGGIACGGTVILVRRFSASTFWRTAAATRATQVNLVAAAGAILVQRPRSEFVPDHRLAKMFVAPQTKAMVEAFREDFGVPVLIECYGMTEIPGVIGNPFPGPHRIGTMGVLCRHPDPRVERASARVVDDEGRDVPRGAVGELLIRTPTIMLGYHRDPGQTAAAFLDGWFRTGDLVTRDADGFFHFVARKKDIIRRRGENVSSAEVERVIADCPGVADVAVVGIPSELGEEEILAAVVARSGETLRAPDIASWTRARLAPAKVPRYVAFVDAIPLTPTHKPAKHRLKDDPGLLGRAVDLQAPRAGTPRMTTGNLPMNEFCQRAVAAMDPGAAGADPALQDRTAVVLKHLHAMLDELRLTQAELYGAMDWLNAVGRDGDFVMLCDVMGLAMRSIALTASRPGATPANVEGPFTKDDIPLSENPVHLAGPDEAGQRIELRGTIRDAATGAPLPGAIMTVWQTNHAGRYENEDPDQPDDNFRTKFAADADGTYCLNTILPGPYEIGSLHSAVGGLMVKLGRARLRAAHIHFRAGAPGYELLTSQIYFEGQPENATDCIFSQHPSITAMLLPIPERPGTLRAEYDIRLAREGAAP